jgi:hypothetical protein
MANGRVPVPIDRAEDIARQVGLPVGQFLKAVLQQQHPKVEWGLITGVERVAGKPAGELSAEHQRVLRELVEDPRPEERWLSKREIAAVKFLRQEFPNMRNRGLSEDDRDAIRVAAALRNAEEGAPHHNEATRQGRKNES